jgi:phosphatidylglycerophosphate synthase
VLDHRLRAYKDQLLRPIAGCVEGFSPNAITVWAAAVGLAAAGAAALSLYWLALGLWLLNRILDGLDGMVARRCSRQSDFGGYLDIVLDFVVYAAVPIGLYLGTPAAGSGFSLILLLASFYINSASWMYLAAILEKRRSGAAARGELTTIIMPPGLIGGTETILFYTAFLIWPGQLPWLFTAMAGLVMVGIGQRLWWARHNLWPGQRPADEAPTRPTHLPEAGTGTPPPRGAAPPGVSRGTLLG